MLILNLALTLIAIFLVVIIVLLYSVFAVYLVRYIWLKVEQNRIKKKYYRRGKNE